MIVSREAAAMYPAMYGDVAREEQPVSRTPHPSGVVSLYVFGFGFWVTKPLAAALVKEGVDLKAEIDKQSEAERAAVDGCVAKLATSKSARCGKTTERGTDLRLYRLLHARPARDVYAQIQVDQKKGGAELLLAADPADMPAVPGNDATFPYVLHVAKERLEAVQSATDD